VTAASFQRGPLARPTSAGSARLRRAGSAVSSSRDRGGRARRRRRPRPTSTSFARIGPKQAREGSPRPARQRRDPGGRHAAHCTRRARPCRLGSGASNPRARCNDRSLWYDAPRSASLGSGAAAGAGDRCRRRGHGPRPGTGRSWSRRRPPPAWKTSDENLLEILGPGRGALPEQARTSPSAGRHTGAQKATPGGRCPGPGGADGERAGPTCSIFIAELRLRSARTPVARSASASSTRRSGSGSPPFQRIDPCDSTWTW